MKLHISISVNIVVQVIGMVLQVLNQYGSLVPTKYQFYVTFAVAILQAVAALLAHFSTPAGNAIPKPEGTK